MYNSNTSLKLSQNKSFEIEINIDRNFGADLFKFKLALNRKCDHAGAEFLFELAEILFFRISFYDHRHWDYNNNRWFEYNEEVDPYEDYR